MKARPAQGYTPAERVILTEAAAIMRRRANPKGWLGRFVLDVLCRIVAPTTEPQGSK